MTPTSLDRSKTDISEIIERNTVMSTSPQLRSEASETLFEAHTSSQFLGSKTILFVVCVLVSFFVRFDRC
jgi:hypothetical protein